MTQIIKDGNYTPRWEGKELTCERCNCIWTLEKGDSVNHNYYEPDIAITHCPKCDKRVVFGDLSLYD